MIGIHVYALHCSHAQLGKQSCVDNTCFDEVDGLYDN